MEKLVGSVTLEDTMGFEIEVETAIGPRVILVKREDFPDLKQGDIVHLKIEKIN